MRLILALGTALTATAATAQVSEAERARLVACAARADDAERLACYDAAVEGLSPEAKAAAAGRAAAAQALAAERAKAKQAAAADRFGREGLRLPGRREPEGLQDVTAELAEMLRDGFGKAVFVLDNGQIWRQTDGPAMPPVRAAETVQVKRGALGSYRLVVPRMKRVVPVVRMR
jgi:hypothetical protein